MYTSGTAYAFTGEIATIRAETAIPPKGDNNDYETFQLHAAGRGGGRE